MTMEGDSFGIEGRIVKKAENLNHECCRSCLLPIIKSDRCIHEVKLEYQASVSIMDCL